MWEQASTKESSHPGAVGNAVRVHVCVPVHVADMCFFFVGRGGLRDKWCRLPKLSDVSFTLGNLCCLKEKKKLFPEPVIQYNFQCVAFFLSFFFFYTRKIAILILEQSMRCSNRRVKLICTTN